MSHPMEYTGPGERVARIDDLRGTIRVVEDDTFAEVDDDEEGVGEMVDRSGQMSRLSRRASNSVRRRSRQPLEEIENEAQVSAGANTDVDKHRYSFASDSTGSKRFL